jgi:hypothetical protein
VRDYAVLADLHKPREGLIPAWTPNEVKQLDLFAVRCSLADSGQMGEEVNERSNSTYRREGSLFASVDGSRERLLRWRTLPYRVRGLGASPTVGMIISVTMGAVYTKQRKDIEKGRRSAQVPVVGPMLGRGQTGLSVAGRF